MRVSDFDFDLPPERIALRPASPRDASKLLVVRPDALEVRVFRELPDLLTRPAEGDDAEVVSQVEVDLAVVERERTEAGIDVFDVADVERQLAIEQAAAAGARAADRVGAELAARVRK